MVFSLYSSKIGYSFLFLITQGFFIFNLIHEEVLFVFVLCLFCFDLVIQILLDLVQNDMRCVSILQHTSTILKKYGSTTKLLVLQRELLSLRSVAMIGTTKTANNTRQEFFVNKGV